MWAEGVAVLASELIDRGKWSTTQEVAVGRGNGPGAETGRRFKRQQLRSPAAEAISARHSQPVVWLLFLLDQRIHGLQLAAQPADEPWPRPRGRRRSPAMYNLWGILLGALLPGPWINRRGSRLPLLLTGTARIASAAWLALNLHAHPAGSFFLSWQIGLHGFFVNGVQTLLYALAAHQYPLGCTPAVLSAFLGGSALHYAGWVYFTILVVTTTGTLLSLSFLRNHIRPGDSPAASSRP